VSGNYSRLESWSLRGVIYTNKKPLKKYTFQKP
jgi:hypothetical protein